jgi:SAM-dependent methyltransferase
VIDYDKASISYDYTKGIDEAVIGRMAAKGAFAHRDGSVRCGGRRARVLDFGCGTGNYLWSLTSLIGSGSLPDCELFGLEPSAGMRAKAAAKNPGLAIRRWRPRRSSLRRRPFDLVYMTDVIHHVPDLDLLFEGFFSKLAPGGRICVVTESHSQIGARWYNAYFSSLDSNEKARYPDIDEIAQRASMAGFNFTDHEIIEGEGQGIVDEAFLKLVREKGYSMFRLLDEAEYETGLSALESDLGRTIAAEGAETSLVCLEKGEA